MEFVTEDLVMINDQIYEVTGVIHDEERLFVHQRLLYDQNDGEQEFPFSKVQETWRKVNQDD